MAEESTPHHKGRMAATTVARPVEMYQCDNSHNKNPRSCAVVRKVVKCVMRFENAFIPHDDVSAPRQLDDHWYGRDGREGSLPVKELEPLLFSSSLPSHAVVSTTNMPFLSLHLEVVASDLNIPTQPQPRNQRRRNNSAKRTSGKGGRPQSTAPCCFSPTDRGPRTPTAPSQGARRRRDRSAGRPPRACVVFPGHSPGPWRAARRLGRSSTPAPLFSESHRSFGSGACDGVGRGEPDPG